MHVFGLAHLVDDFALKEITMWGQSKILELTIRVSVGRFMGGENIHLLMLHVVDLLLGNPGGRDRRPNYTIFVVACCAPNTDSRWW